MNPFHFGTSARALFGIYHPPEATPGRSAGMILCAPMGQDYMRSHRALRHLATQLARAGFPVLRFDYFGTGDSAGVPDDVRLEDWLDDVGAAVQEARDASGRAEVSLVGLRLGATLAWLAASRHPVEDLVLWDPVVRGGTYLRELSEGAQVPDSAPPPDAPYGVHGFPLGRPLWEDLAALDLLAAPHPSLQRTMLVVSTEGDDSIALRTALERRGNRLTYRYIPGTGAWDDLDRLGAALLPHEVIRSIVSWASEPELPQHR